MRNNRNMETEHPLRKPQKVNQREQDTAKSDRSTPTKKKSDRQNRKFAQFYYEYSNTHSI